VTPRRRGAALPLALVVAVFLHAVVAVALWAALADLRLVAGVRFGIDGEIVVSSALAASRVGSASIIDGLLPGESVPLPVIANAGWTVRVTAMRVDSLVFLRARAEFRSAGDSLLGARSGTLVLAHDSSDTVRVLRGRSRF
jgi:hypothetical protein